MCVDERRPSGARRSPKLLMTETQINPAFGQPVSFVDPRRAMLGVRINLGR